MIEPSDIITEAKTLADVDGLNQEARCRTVLGRIYYGIYHAIGEHEELAPIVVEFNKRYREKRKTDRKLRHLTAHRMVQQALLENDDENHQYLGTLLQTLFNRRIDADYKLTKLIHRTAVDDSLDIAEEILADHLGLKV